MKRWNVDKSTGYVEYLDENGNTVEAHYTAEMDVQDMAVYLDEVLSDAWDMDPDSLKRHVTFFEGTEDDDYYEAWRVMGKLNDLNLLRYLLIQYGRHDLVWEWPE